MPKHGDLAAGFLHGAAKQSLRYTASRRLRGSTHYRLSRRTCILRAASHCSWGDVSWRRLMQHGAQSQLRPRQRRPEDFSLPRYGTRARANRQSWNARQCWRCNQTHRFVAAMAPSVAALLDGGSGDRGFAWIRDAGMKLLFPLDRSPNEFRKNRLAKRLPGTVCRQRPVNISVRRQSGLVRQVFGPTPVRVAFGPL